MIKVAVRYYVVRKGRGYWLVSPKMRAAGFRNVCCGPDGPAAWTIAEAWNERWQRVRRGQEPALGATYPLGSLGDAFSRYKRSETWKGKKPRTREDWERGWKMIDRVFGDIRPNDVTFDLVDEWYAALLETRGISEAFRAMKIWRALWQVAAAMKLCVADADPSAGVRRKTPRGRSQVWHEGEVVRLAKSAWRLGYRGLACIIAVAWDTGFSPVDVRNLTLNHRIEVVTGSWAFSIGRTKTGESALGTLSKRTRRVIAFYLAGLGMDLHGAAPMFRHRSRGPYSKDTLGDDFRDVRAALFGPAEKRQLMDLRRSGAVEAIAGDASAEALAAKMGNSIDDNKALQRTYLPVDAAVVRTVDAARLKGRSRMRENKSGPKS